MSLYEKKSLGTIHVDKDITISDPCYDHNIWCNCKLANMAPGDYDCYYKLTHCKIPALDLGNRVSEIEIKLSDKGINYEPDYRKLAVDIGVDSGNCGFILRSGDSGPILTESEQDTVFDMIYKSPLTRSTIIPGIGFISESGMGDGDYDLYAAIDDKGYYDALKLIFLDEEDWKDE